MKKPKTVPFNRLNAAGKRVAIAMDVIAQIHAKAYHIQTGTWAYVNIVQDDADTPELIDQNILVNGPAPIRRRLSCTCCGIGAAFLSSIRLANKDQFPMGGICGFERAASQLQKFFPVEQLQMIEEAFERGVGNCHTESGKACGFGERYSNDTKRCLAIFQNIVKNKGTFIP